MNSLGIVLSGSESDSDKTTSVYIPSRCVANFEISEELKTKINADLYRVRVQLRDIYSVTHQPSEAARAVKALEDSVA